VTGLNVNATVNIVNKVQWDGLFCALDGRNVDFYLETLEVSIIDFRTPQRTTSQTSALTAGCCCK